MDNVSRVDLDNCKLLLKHLNLRQKINDTDQNGQAILHYLFYQFSIDINKNQLILAELVSQGADINVLNSEKNTPLVISVKKNQLSTLQFALHQKRTKNINFDFYSQNNFGQTVLHIASNHCYFHIVMELFSLPDLLFIPDNSGKIARYYSIGNLLTSKLFYKEEKY